MKGGFTVIIPARIASTRLPGKVLIDIGGKPLLQHVYEAAVISSAKQVYIATGDREIQSAAEAFGASCILTSGNHNSGTDRIAEAAGLLDLPDTEIIVNVQGDEFGLPSEIINQVAFMLESSPGIPMATLYEKICNESDLDNRDIVKVVVSRMNTALYFSRLPIPCNRNRRVHEYFRHIGIYAYRTEYLQRFSALPACELELTESLEQLRALYNGDTILVEETCKPTGIGIDTEEDLQLARESVRSL